MDLTEMRNVRRRVEAAIQIELNRQLKAFSLETGQRASDIRLINITNMEDIAPQYRIELVVEL